MPPKAAAPLDGPTSPFRSNGPATLYLQWDQALTGMLTLAVQEYVNAAKDFITFVQDPQLLDPVLASGEGGAQPIALSLYDEHSQLLVAPLSTWKSGEFWQRRNQLLKKMTAECSDLCTGIVTTLAAGKSSSLTEGKSSKFITVASSAPTAASATYVHPGKGFFIRVWDHARAARRFATSFGRVASAIAENRIEGISVPVTVIMTYGGVIVTFTTLPPIIRVQLTIAAIAKRAKELPENAGVLLASVKRLHSGLRLAPTIDVPFNLTRAGTLAVVNVIPLLIEQSKPHLMRYEHHAMWHAELDAEQMLQQATQQAVSLIQSEMARRLSGSSGDATSSIVSSMFRENFVSNTAHSVGLSVRSLYHVFYALRGKGSEGHALPASNLVFAEMQLRTLKELIRFDHNLLSADVENSGLGDTAGCDVMLASRVQQVQRVVAAIHDSAVMESFYPNVILPALRKKFGIPAAFNVPFCHAKEISIALGDKFGVTIDASTGKNVTGPVLTTTGSMLVALPECVRLAQLIATNGSGSFPPDASQPVRLKELIEYGVTTAGKATANGSVRFKCLVRAAVYAGICSSADAVPVVQLFTGAVSALSPGEKLVYEQTASELQSVTDSAYSPDATAVATSRSVLASFPLASLVLEFYQADSNPNKRLRNMLLRAAASKPVEKPSAQQFPRFDSIYYAEKLRLTSELVANKHPFGDVLAMLAGVTCLTAPIWRAPVEKSPFLDVLDGRQAGKLLLAALQGPKGLLSMDALTVSASWAAEASPELSKAFSFELLPNYIRALCTKTPIRRAYVNDAAQVTALFGLAQAAAIAAINEPRDVHEKAVVVIQAILQSLRSQCDPNDPRCTVLAVQLMAVAIRKHKAKALQRDMQKASSSSSSFAASSSAAPVSQASFAQRFSLKSERRAETGDAVAFAAANEFSAKTPSEVAKAVSDYCAFASKLTLATPGDAAKLLDVTTATASQEIIARGAHCLMNANDWEPVAAFCHAVMAPPALAQASSPSAATGPLGSLFARHAKATSASSTLRKLFFKPLPNEAPLAITTRSVSRAAELSSAQTDAYFQGMMIFEATRRSLVALPMIGDEETLKRGLIAATEDTDFHTMSNNLTSGLGLSLLLAGEEGSRRGLSRDEQSTFDALQRMVLEDAETCGPRLFLEREWWRSSATVKFPTLPCFVGLSQEAEADLRTLSLAQEVAAYASLTREFQMSGATRAIDATVERESTARSQLSRECLSEWIAELLPTHEVCQRALFSEAQLASFAAIVKQASSSSFDMLVDGLLAGENAARCVLTEVEWRERMESVVTLEVALRTQFIRDDLMVRTSAITDLASLGYADVYSSQKSAFALLHDQFKSELNDLFTGVTEKNETKQRATLAAAEGLGIVKLLEERAVEFIEALGRLEQRTRGEYQEQQRDESLRVAYEYLSKDEREKRIALSAQQDRSMWAEGIIFLENGLRGCHIVAFVAAALEILVDAEDGMRKSITASALKVMASLTDDAAAAIFSEMEDRLVKLEKRNRAAMTHEWGYGWLTDVLTGAEESERDAYIAMEVNARNDAAVKYAEASAGLSRSNLLTQGITGLKILANEFTRELAVLASEQEEQLRRILDLDESTSRSQLLFNDLETALRTAVNRDQERLRAKLAAEFTEGRRSMLFDTMELSEKSERKALIQNRQQGMGVLLQQYEEAERDRRFELAQLETFAGIRADFQKNLSALQTRGIEFVYLQERTSIANDALEDRKAILAWYCLDEKNLSWALLFVELVTKTQGSALAVLQALRTYEENRWCYLQEQFVEGRFSLLEATLDAELRNARSTVVSAGRSSLAGLVIEAADDRQRIFEDEERIARRRIATLMGDAAQNTLTSELQHEERAQRNMYAKQWQTEMLETLLQPAEWQHRLLLSRAEREWRIAESLAFEERTRIGVDAESDRRLAHMADAFTRQRDWLQLLHLQRDEQESRRQIRAESCQAAASLVELEETDSRSTLDEREFVEWETLSDTIRQLRNSTASVYITDLELRTRRQLCLAHARDCMEVWTAGQESLRSQISADELARRLEMVPVVAFSCLETMVRDESLLRSVMLSKLDRQSRRHQLLSVEEEEASDRSGDIVVPYLAFYEKIHVVEYEATLREYHWLVTEAAKWEAIMERERYEHWRLLVDVLELERETDRNRQIKRQADVFLHALSSLGFDLHRSLACQQRPAFATIAAECYASQLRVTVCEAESRKFSDMLNWFYSECAPLLVSCLEADEVTLRSAIQRSEHANVVALLTDDAESERRWLLQNEERRYRHLHLGDLQQRELALEHLHCLEIEERRLRLQLIRVVEPQALIDVMDRERESSASITVSAEEADFRRYIMDLCESSLREAVGAEEVRARALARKMFQRGAASHAVEQALLDESRARQEIEDDWAKPLTVRVERVTRWGVSGTGASPVMSPTVVVMSEARTMAAAPSSEQEEGDEKASFLVAGPPAEDISLPPAAQNVLRIGPLFTSSLESNRNAVMSEWQRETKLLVAEYRHLHRSAQLERLQSTEARARTSLSEGTCVQLTDIVLAMEADRRAAVGNDEELRSRDICVVGAEVIAAGIKASESASRIAIVTAFNIRGSHFSAQRLERLEVQQRGEIEGELWADFYTHTCLQRWQEPHERQRIDANWATATAALGRAIQNLVHAFQRAVLQRQELRGRTDVRKEVISEVHLVALQQCTEPVVRHGLVVREYIQPLLQWTLPRFEDYIRHQIATSERVEGRQLRDRAATVIFGHQLSLLENDVERRERSVVYDLMCANVFRIADEMECHRREVIVRDETSELDDVVRRNSKGAAAEARRSLQQAEAAGRSILGVTAFQGLAAVAADREVEQRCYVQDEMVARFNFLVFQRLETKLREVLELEGQRPLAALVKSAAAQGFEKRLIECEEAERVARRQAHAAARDALAQIAERTETAVRGHVSLELADVQEAIAFMEQTERDKLQRVALDTAERRDRMVIRMDSVDAVLIAYDDYATSSRFAMRIGFETARVSMVTHAGLSMASSIVAEEDRQFTKMLAPFYDVKQDLEMVHFGRREKAGRHGIADEYRLVMAQSAEELAAAFHDALLRREEDDWEAYVNAPHNARLLREAITELEEEQDDDRSTLRTVERIERRGRLVAASEGLARMHLEQRCVIETGSLLMRLFETKLYGHLTLAAASQFDNIMSQCKSAILQVEREELMSLALLAKSAIRAQYGHLLLEATDGIAEPAARQGVAVEQQTRRETLFLRHISRQVTIRLRETQTMEHSARREILGERRDEDLDLLNRAADFTLRCTTGAEEWVDRVCLLFASRSSSHTRSLEERLRTIVLRDEGKIGRQMASTWAEERDALGEEIVRRDEMLSRRLIVADGHASARAVVELGEEPWMRADHARMEAAAFVILRKGEAVGKLLVGANQIEFEANISRQTIVAAQLQLRIRLLQSYAEHGHNAWTRVEQRELRADVERLAVSAFGSVTTAESQRRMIIHTQYINDTRERNIEDLIRDESRHRLNRLVAPNALFRAGVEDERFMLTAYRPLLRDEHAAIVAWQRTFAATTSRLRLTSLQADEHSARVSHRQQWALTLSTALQDLESHSRHTLIVHIVRPFRSTALQRLEDQVREEFTAHERRGRLTLSKELALEGRKLLVEALQIAERTSRRELVAQWVAKWSDLMQSVMEHAVRAAIGAQCEAALAPIHRRFHTGLMAIEVQEAPVIAFTRPLQWWKERSRFMLRAVEDLEDLDRVDIVDDLNVDQYFHWQMLAFEASARAAVEDEGERRLAAVLDMHRSLLDQLQRFSLLDAERFERQSIFRLGVYGVRRPVPSPSTGQVSTPSKPSFVFALDVDISVCHFVQHLRIAQEAVHRGAIDADESRTRRASLMAGDRELQEDLCQNEAQKQKQKMFLDCLGRCREQYVVLEDQVRRETLKEINTSRAMLFAAVGERLISWRFTEGLAAARRELSTVHVEVLEGLRQHVSDQETLSRIPIAIKAWEWQMGTLEAHESARRQSIVRTRDTRLSSEATSENGPKPMEGIRGALSRGELLPWVADVVRSPNGLESASEGGDGEERFTSLWHWYVAHRSLVSGNALQRDELAGRHKLDRNQSEVRAALVASLEAKLRNAADIEQRRTFMSAVEHFATSFCEQQYATFLIGRAQLLANRVERAFEALLQTQIEDERVGRRSIHGERFGALHTGLLELEQLGRGVIAQLEDSAAELCMGHGTREVATAQRLESLETHSVRVQRDVWMEEQTARVAIVLVAEEGARDATEMERRRRACRVLSAMDGEWRVVASRDEVLWRHTLQCLSADAAFELQSNMLEEEAAIGREKIRNEMSNSREEHIFVPYATGWLDALGREHVAAFNVLMTAAITARHALERDVVQRNEARQRQRFTRQRVEWLMAVMERQDDARRGIIVRHWQADVAESFVGLAVDNFVATLISQESRQFQLIRELFHGGTWFQRTLDVVAVELRQRRMLLESERTIRIASIIVPSEFEHRRGIGSDQRSLFDRMQASAREESVRAPRLAVERSEKRSRVGTVVAPWVSELLFITELAESSARTAICSQQHRTRMETVVRAEEGLRSGMERQEREVRRLSLGAAFHQLSYFVPKAFALAREEARHRLAMIQLQIEGKGLLCAATFVDGIHRDICFQEDIELEYQIERPFMAALAPMQRRGVELAEQSQRRQTAVDALVAFPLSQWIAAEDLQRRALLEGFFVASLRALDKTEAALRTQISRSQAFVMWDDLGGWFVKRLKQLSVDNVEEQERSRRASLEQRHDALMMRYFDEHLTVTLGDLDAQVLRTYSQMTQTREAALRFIFEQQRRGWMQYAVRKFHERHFTALERERVASMILIESSELDGRETIHRFIVHISQCVSRRVLILRSEAGGRRHTVAQCYVGLAQRWEWCEQKSRSMIQALCEEGIERMVTEQATAIHAAFGSALWARRVDWWSQLVQYAERHRRGSLHAANISLRGELGLAAHQDFARVSLTDYSTSVIPWSRHWSIISRCYGERIEMAKDRWRALQKYRAEAEVERTLLERMDAAAQRKIGPKASAAAAASRSVSVGTSQAASTAKALPSAAAAASPPLATGAGRGATQMRAITKMMAAIAPTISPSQAAALSTDGSAIVDSSGGANRRLLPPLDASSASLNASDTNVGGLLVGLDRERERQIMFEVRCARQSLSSEQYIDFALIMRQRQRECGRLQDQAALWSSPHRGHVADADLPRLPPANLSASPGSKASAALPPIRASTEDRNDDDDNVMDDEASLNPPPPPPAIPPRRAVQIIAEQDQFIDPESTQGHRLLRLLRLQQRLRPGASDGGAAEVPEDKEARVGVDSPRHPAHPELTPLALSPSNASLRRRTRR